MQFEEKLDVIEENIAKYSRELLDILLKIGQQMRILFGQLMIIFVMGSFMRRQSKSTRT